MAVLCIYVAIRRWYAAAVVECTSSENIVEKKSFFLETLFFEKKSFALKRKKI